MTDTRAGSGALTAHYAEVIRYIETAVQSRVPRMFRGSGLTPDEVAEIAAGLAHAHHVAGREKSAVTTPPMWCSSSLTASFKGARPCFCEKPHGHEGMHRDGSCSWGIADAGDGAA